MSTPLELKVEKREQVGHANTKLAPQGLVPAVVYGEAIEPMSVQASAHDVELLFAQHGDNIVLSLAIEGGDPVVALVRDMQRHPITRKVMHIDFLLASATKTVVTEVDLVLEGNPIGVREDGGILNIALHTITIDALVKDIPEQIVHDISDLALNDVLTAGDLTMPANVTLAADPTTPVCSIVAPVAEEAEEELAAEEAAEGEAAEVAAKAEDAEGAEE